MSNGFYIGGKCVCVKTHSRGRVTKGRTYVIEGFACCKFCGSLSLDVGLDNAPGERGTRCHKCKVLRCVSETGVFISALLFRPLEERTATAELARTEADRASEPEVETVAA